MVRFTTQLILVTVFCVFFSVKTLAAKLTERHGHPTYDAPENWGTKYNKACGVVGSTKGQQSPINIVKDDVTYDAEISPLNIDYFTAGFNFINKESHDVPNSAIVLINGNESDPQTLSGGNLPEGKTFRLSEFHFHTTSEHEIGGDREPLEMQLVHTNKDGGVAKIAIISILFKLHSNGNPFLEQFLQSWVNNSAATIDFDTLFPQDAATNFYTYSGSLTVPPCTEIVTWFIAGTPMTISLQQLIAMEQLFTHETNVRPVQLINGRDIKCRGVCEGIEQPVIIAPTRFVQRSVIGPIHYEIIYYLLIILGVCVFCWGSLLVYMACNHNEQK